MQLDVAAARIYTTMHGFALDSFQVLLRSRGEGEHYRDLIQKVEAGLAERIAPGATLDPASAGRVSRWVRHFPIEPSVTIVPGRREGHWTVNVSCADRPGLLSSLARVFLEHGLNLVDARVTTLGARAEDVFVVTGGEVADVQRRERIIHDLCKLAA
jgi:[protein-PII] uridylyltransferase